MVMQIKLIVVVVVVEYKLLLRTQLSSLKRIIEIRVPAIITADSIKSTAS